jgi:hypothetical protein
MREAPQMDRRPPAPEQRPANVPRDDQSRRQEKEKRPEHHELIRQVQFVHDIKPHGRGRRGDSTPVINEAKLWRNNGWTARIIKNEDDEGWPWK